LTFGLADRSGEKLLVAVTKKAGQILIHPAGLLARAAQDSDLAFWLEKTIQKRCDGSKLGLAPGTIRPNDNVCILFSMARFFAPLRMTSKMAPRINCISVPEIIHRALMVATDSLIRHFNAEKDLHIVFQVPLCDRLSSPEL
jgi:hypothetical protein